MYRQPIRALLVIQVLLLFVPLGHAQSAILDLPRPSQHAVVTQRIGITDITINYHRPLVNRRKIWAASSPTGRFGAPEPTKTPPSHSVIP